MLLKCAGKCLEGSGAENVWLEAGFYGPRVIQNSILDGGHYTAILWMGKNSQQNQCNAYCQRTSFP